MFLNEDKKNDQKFDKIAQTVGVTVPFTEGRINMDYRFLNRSVAKKK